MATYFTLLTPAGLAKVANAQLTNQKIEISEVAAGDGNGAAYQPLGTETALKNEVWRGGIASVELDSQNLNWIVVEAIVPASAGGFTIREVGLFDSEGTMIAIGNYPDTYKPVVSDGATMDLALRTIIEVGNTSNVTLKIDPNVIVASRKYVDDRVASSIGNIGTNLIALDNRVTAHLAETASQTQLGHVMVDGISIFSKDDGEISNYEETLITLTQASTVINVTNLDYTQLEIEIRVPSLTSNVDITKWQVNNVSTNYSQWTSSVPQASGNITSSGNTSLDGWASTLNGTISTISRKKTLYLEKTTPLVMSAYTDTQITANNLGRGSVNTTSNINRVNLTFGAALPVGTTVRLRGNKK